MTTVVFGSGSDVPVSVAAARLRDALLPFGRWPAFNLLLILCCVLLLLATHPPACSYGWTPLTCHQARYVPKPDVVALLRSVVASE